jgi:hypothetical protein
MMTTIPAETLLLAGLDGPPDAHLVKIRDLVYQVAVSFSPTINFVFSKSDASAA